MEARFALSRNFVFQAHVSDIIVRNVSFYAEIFTLFRAPGANAQKST